MPGAFKRISKALLTQSQVNRSLRALLAIGGVRALISPTQLKRFPVVGRVELALWDDHCARFYSDGEDTIVTKLYWQGLPAFEPSTFDLFRTLLVQTRCFVDIGANTGFYTIVAGASDATRRIHAFEPVPAINRYLRRNVAANGLTQVTVNESAVTDYDGRIKLYIPDAAMLPTSASTLAGFRTAALELERPAVTLDAYFEQANEVAIDLIKIDTEGTEHLVLAGARRILTQHRPAIICEVLKGQTEPQLHAVLDPTDYHYFLITEAGLIQKTEIAGDPTYQNLNYLFVTPERMQQMGLSAA
ncbi:MAG: FkbM family methyltransferase [Chloroflexota bacterium]|nr:FkbM family methyltransferase [Chloroflexota bacterium]